MVISVPQTDAKIAYWYVRLHTLRHARVSQVFLNTCWGIGSGGFSSLFMVGACCWRFGRGRDKVFVLYISLFSSLRVLGCWVFVCLYTRIHTHKLLGYLM